jgi:hypothetical protein
MILIIELGISVGLVFEWGRRRHFNICPKWRVGFKGYAKQ